MSRTDKTRPYWVQLRDPLFPWPLRAHHRHHWPWPGHECNLDFPLPVTRGRGSCKWWPRDKDNDKIYGRRRYQRTYPSFHNQARASLRNLRAQWLKATPEDREDIDSRENLPTARWLWRSWYWD
jgi:hypothetical protein